MTGRKEHRSLIQPCCYELAFIATWYDGLAFLRSLATDFLVSTWMGDPLWVATA